MKPDAIGCHRSAVGWRRLERTVAERRHLTSLGFQPKVRP
ncbi:hypothetical protein RISK_006290 [Rhodopirellula islandica]|uniref:Uncharacterized protein n=1 Tax=Rhodopirellula islandica TaxID=595434 RepID=A0A0J1B480_RHOIS|nr:hypothetical protein RISK_006290 [Rhodopirellula islandica]